MASCSLLVLATTCANVVLSCTKSCRAFTRLVQCRKASDVIFSEDSTPNKSSNVATVATELKSQFCVLGCLASTCCALHSLYFNCLSTSPSQHASSTPFTFTFYQLLSCGGSNHPITDYVPQLQCISILVMVVLATAAMVTRQVSTGGGSKVAVGASKWKEMDGENRAAFIGGASSVPSSGGRPLAPPLNVSKGNAEYKAAQCMQA